MLGKKLIKSIYIIFGLVALLGIGKAGYDFQITDIYFSDGSESLSKGSNPVIDLVLRNDGNSIARNNGTIPEGFINCTFSGVTVGRTPALSEFILNAGTTNILELQLSKLLTATARTVNILCSIGLGDNSAYFGSAEDRIDNNSKSFSFTIGSGGRFDSSINDSISSIRNHLDAAEPNSTMGGGVSVKNFIFKLISNFLIPIMVIASIIVAIVGIYNLLTSDKQENIKKGTNMLIFGVIGIIIMLSAQYLGTVIFEDIFGSGNLSDLDSINTVSLVYEKIAYPFIKMAIYLSLGILFLVLAGKTLSILTSGDIKKAGTMIGWTAISMLVIIGAKQIVEAVYGKQQEVLNTQATNLGEIGSGILADKNIPLLYNVINWVLGLTSLVLLILILVQTFQILVNPSKADNRKKLGKSILYMFIGLVIIGVGYILTNLFVIN